MEELLKALLDVYIPVLNANCKKTFAFLDEYVPPPTRKERRKRERELKKKFPLDFTKFIESHRTIYYWDYNACNLRPEYLFSSIDKAKKAILKVDKSKIITILYE